MIYSKNKVKKPIKENFNKHLNGITISSESASEEGFEVEPVDNTNKNNDGYENHRSLEDYLGFDPDLGLTRSEELSKGPFEDYFKNPKIMEKFSEYMDITDKDTRKFLITMTEAEQNSALLSLTSKLYDNIVSKVDDIDYRDIPNTKGDITKLPNYDKLRECIDLLRDILKEYKQDTSPIDEISVALSNVIARKDLFNRAFRLDVELPIIMYNNLVLAIIDAVSFMIATSIEFIKVPNQDSFQIVLDKVAYTKTKNNMLYHNLKNINKLCAKGDFDKALNHIIKTKTNGTAHEAGVLGAAVAIGGTKAFGIGVAIGAVLALIPILRSLIFLFYHARMRLSEFFDIQADLLQMNAYNLQNSEDMMEERKEKVVSKQLKIVEWFRKAANRLSFTNKKAEVETTKEINSNNNKLTINDINASGNGVSALF